MARAISSTVFWGLAEIARRLEAIGDVVVVRLGDADIVRHALVAEMPTVL